MIATKTTRLRLVYLLSWYVTQLQKIDMHLNELIASYIVLYLILYIED